MSKIYKIRKNRMKQTLDAYFKHSYKSAAACAREFDLDPRLFQKRLKIERFRFNRVISIKLSDHQELALKKYIEFLDSIELSVRLSIIRDIANFLLYKAHLDENFDDSASRVRRNWIDRFMKRNSQFFLKKSKSLTAKRKNSHNVKNMIKFYSNFNYWMKNFDCTSHDTWNMNETSFRVNCEISHLMMTLSQRKMIITDSDNRDYIIFAKCINETDDSIFSFLILKEVNILSKWALKNDLDDDVVLSTSDIDYSNDVLAFEWLKHFDTHSKKLQKDLFRMLVMNDYESHLTYEFYEYAKSHDIYLMKLFFHSTHLTQSLNVEMF